MTAPTPEQMRALESDAFAALQEAIDTGRIVMRVPADEQSDTDLRIGAALVALRSAANELDRLRAVIADAPHDERMWGVQCSAGLEDAPCICWKAE